jgi:hypothetical protein
MPALLETLLAVLLCIGVMLLPPWLASLFWLGALALFAFTLRIERRGNRRAPHFLRALSGLMPLAVAGSLMVWAWPMVGPWIALPLGLAAAGLAALLHARVFALLLRPSDGLGARFPFTSEHARSGLGGHVWSRLPGSGLRFRMVPGATPRSSQPQGCTWVFEDGHVLEGRDRSLSVSRDGRWLVVRDLRERAVVALDRQASMRYRWQQGDALWSAIEANERWPKMLEDWRERADRSEALLLRFGLWLTEAEFEHAGPDRIEIADPLGRPRLVFQARREPQDVVAALQPLIYALRPRYAVQLDRQTLPFAVAGPQSAVWRADGQALLLMPEDGEGAWLHEDGKPPRRFPLRWSSAHGHPSLSFGRVRVLEAKRIGIELRQGRVAAGYPQQWDAASAEAGYRFGSTLAWASPLPDGAVRYRDCSVRGELMLWLRLDDIDDAGASAEVESLGPGGRVALFQRQAERCWRCRLGPKLLSASPLALAHLWSDDGRHLVLQTSTEGDAVSESCMVVETASGELLGGAVQCFDLSPVAMIEGVLQVRRVLGRVNAPNGELLRLPPEAARGRAFLDARRNSWLRFACDRYQLSADGLSVLGPIKRALKLRVAPSPMAAFDLLYPAPGGGWAYVEGARGRNDDVQPRPQDARFAARMVTRDGLGCAGLSPAMIWSADGRWLLLVHAPDSSQPRWVPWVLDTAKEQLYRPRADETSQAALPGMPFFLNFHAGVVRYEWVETPWWTQDIERRSGVLPLDSLLARYESVALSEADGLKVPPEQVDLLDWRALARSAARQRD